MTRDWLTFVIVVVPCAAGAVGVMTGLGFRKGFPFGCRLVAIVACIVWFGVFFSLFAFFTSHSGEADPLRWLKPLAGACVASLWFIGIHVIWGLISNVSRAARHRFSSRHGEGGRDVSVARTSRPEDDQRASESGETLQRISHPEVEATSDGADERQRDGETQ